jgi:hypothetical protein
MYEYYESKAKFGRRAFLPRLALAFVFLATLGFAGGVLYLLFFLVPFEQRLVPGRGRDSLHPRPGQPRQRRHGTQGIRDPKRRAVEGIRSLRIFVPSVAVKNSTTEHHY